jgi:hypothetical protein
VAVESGMAAKATPAASVRLFIKASFHKPDPYTPFPGPFHDRFDE